MWYEHGQENIDPFRTGKAYSVVQAARLAGTTPATVRRWLAGYEVPGHQMAPVFGGTRLSSEKAPWFVSFLELVEIVVVARFRRGSPGHPAVKLDRLRRAHAYAREQLHLAYPFASLQLKEYGGHILHEFDLREPSRAALALDMGGQWVLPGLVREELTHFEYRDHLASRWFPVGLNTPIVVDPRIGAGRPTILGSGVTVDTICGRFAAGESIDFIAQDFGLEPAQIEKALQFAAAAA